MISRKEEPIPEDLHLVDISWPLRARLMFNRRRIRRRESLKNFSPKRMIIFDRKSNVGLVLAPLPPFNRMTDAGSDVRACSDSRLHESK